MGSFGSLVWSSLLQTSRRRRRCSCLVIKGDQQARYRREHKWMEGGLVSEYGRWEDERPHDDPGWDGKGGICIRRGGKRMGARPLMAKLTIHFYFLLSEIVSSRLDSPHPSQWVSSPPPTTHSAVWLPFYKAQCNGSRLWTASRPTTFTMDWAGWRCKSGPPASIPSSPSSVARVR